MFFVTENLMFESFILISWFPSIIIKLSNSSKGFANLTEIFELLGTISGLAESERGFKEVITKAFVFGDRIGPPAESEYAVEPFEVEMISPSALFR